MISIDIFTVFLGIILDMNIEMLAGTWLVLTFFMSIFLDVSF